MPRKRRNQDEQGLPGLNGTSLILGETLPGKTFGFEKEKTSPPQFIEARADGHLCTVAPTRSGKGVGVIIPNLLNYRGPVIVFDPKGENYMVTARRRREMGHRVIKLDPFHVIEDSSDGFNPFDLFDLPGTDLECESQAIAELLSRGVRGGKEPFWDLSGTAFASGLVAYAATQGDQGKKNLNTVVEKLTADDVIYGLAVVLDTIGKKISPLGQREIASVLQMPELTRGGVVATTQSYLKPFNSGQVLRTLERSTFDLQDVVDGKPLSIYLMIPPSRIHSHRGLLKLWFGALLTAILSRRYRPALNTLVIFDEVAQLEYFPLLETLITLSAGYGVTAHLFFQDLAQLKTWYPSSWKTILNNCSVIQTFGVYNRDMATQWSDYMDFGAHQLRSLAVDEQILSRHGSEDLKCRRLSYLDHPIFAGLFDKNRFFEPNPGSPRTRRSGARGST